MKILGRQLWGKRKDKSRFILGDNTNQALENLISAAIPLTEKLDTVPVPATPELMDPREYSAVTFVPTSNRRKAPALKLEEVQISGDEPANAYQTRVNSALQERIKTIQVRHENLTIANFAYRILTAKDHPNYVQFIGAFPNLDADAPSSLRESYDRAIKAVNDTIGTSIPSLLDSRPVADVRDNIADVLKAIDKTDVEISALVDINQLMSGFERLGNSAQGIMLIQDAKQKYFGSINQHLGDAYKRFSDVLSKAKVDANSGKQEMKLDNRTLATAILANHIVSTHYAQKE